VSERPDISVIIPFHNAARTLVRCLDALRAETGPAFEIIVVDDASTEEGAALAHARAVHVISLAVQRGPAAARNAGAAVARGDILLFVDADVVVHAGTLQRVAGHLAADSPYAAVFGSYDTEPEPRDFLSQYRNLLHHFVHQAAREEASTFWTGCGAVRTESFRETGGFDPVWEAIEDIDLGLRLRQKGARILLDKHLLATHLKAWPWSVLWRTDLFSRAIPWSRLMIERGHLLADLNVGHRERWSAGLLGMGLIAIAASLWEPRFMVIAFVIGPAYLWLNRHCYAFFLRKRGAWFTLRVLPLHGLFYLYSAAGFAVALWTCRDRLRRVVKDWIRCRGNALRT
jgi:glycosyltransferase involved in cell wall biosynthesis